ncbi:MAG: acyltransferase [Clostridiales bacterium]|nr:acyltransferase [Clostridiales bacterium]
MKKTEAGQFSVRETNIVKGVAIIILVFHHCFLSTRRFGAYDVSFFPFTEEIIIFAARAGKCCVGIFTFLSAYGLSRTYQKRSACGEGEISDRVRTEKFVLRRTVNLLSGFLFVFVLVFVCGLFLGPKPSFSYYTKDSGVLLSAYYVLLDALGLSNLADTPSLIATWWYMGLALTVILLFPMMFKLYQKFGWVLIPAFFCLLCSLQLDISDFNRWLVLVPIGILFADRNLLERIKAHPVAKRPSVDFLLKFLGTSGIVLLLAYLSADSYEIEAYGAKLLPGLLAIAVVIWASIFLTNLPVVSPILAFLGKQSMNIYLIHNFLRDRWFETQIYSCKHFVLIVLVLLAISTVLSIGINTLKKYSGYDHLVQKLHQWLGA